MSKYIRILIIFIDQGRKADTTDDLALRVFCVRFAWFVACVPAGGGLRCPGLESDGLMVIGVGRGVVGVGSELVRGQSPGHRRCLSRLCRVLTAGVGRLCARRSWPFGSGLEVGWCVCRRVVGWWCGWG